VIVKYFRDRSRRKPVNLFNVPAREPDAVALTFNGTRGAAFSFWRRPVRLRPGDCHVPA
jgi:hypothetical protein